PVVERDCGFDLGSGRRRPSEGFVGTPVTGNDVHEISGDHTGPMPAHVRVTEVPGVHIDVEQRLVAVAPRWVVPSAATEPRRADESRNRPTANAMVVAVSESKT